MELQLDTIVNAECLAHLKTMPDECLDCVVTSPPYYGLRDYGCDGQVGLEDTPEDYIQRLVDIFHEVKRCLKPEGTLWLNLGDSYCGTGSKSPQHQDPKNKSGLLKQVESKTTKLPGYKQKDLIGIPWMAAFALRADGWYLRQDIIWAKPNPMPEPIKDRCTKSHEYIFLLTKSAKYYFNYEAIQEDAITDENRPAGVVRNRKFGYDSKQNKNPEAYMMTGTNRQSEVTEDDMPTGKRNKRDVWQVAPKPSTEAHYAMYPEELVKYCVEAGCPVGGVVFDPFMGSGTTAAVAKKFDRHYYGTELNPKFYEIAARRVASIMSFISPSFDPSKVNKENK